MTQYIVRLMREEDIPELVQLEREAFPTQTPGTSFHRELNNRLAKYMIASRSRTEGVQQNDGVSQHELLGYAGLWFVLEEAHLTAIAVQVANRRQGIGHRLLITAMELARERAASLMTLEVRVSNASAQALYEKFGFRHAGVRRGYYTDNHEDAYLMTVEHIDSDEYAAQLESLKSTFPMHQGGDDLAQADRPLKPQD